MGFIKSLTTVQSVPKQVGDREDFSSFFLLQICGWLFVPETRGSIDFPMQFEYLLPGGFKLVAVHLAD